MEKIKLSERISKVSPSLTLAITAKAKAMIEAGEDVVPFGAGEPDFPTPRHIAEAAKRALDEGLTKYTPSAGLPQLRREICRKLKEENNLEYDPSQIIVSNGAKQSVFNACFALLNDGDEAIIPAPYWLTYPETVKLCGGVPVILPARSENGFKITAEELESAITPKTKLLIFNSPCNPTGAVYSEKEIREIAAVCVRRGVFVLSDEIYEKLVYGGVKHFSIASVSEEMKNLTVTVNGVSKTYAMTGFRIGYLAAPKEIAAAIDSFQSHATSNACTISQYAAIEALSSPGEEVQKNGGYFRAAAQRAFKGGGKNQGRAVRPTGRRVLRHAEYRRGVRKIGKRKNDPRFRRFLRRASGRKKGGGDPREGFRRGRIYPPFVHVVRRKNRKGHGAHRRIFRKRATRLIVLLEA